MTKAIVSYTQSITKELVHNATLGSMIAILNRGKYSRVFNQIIYGCLVFLFGVILLLAYFDLNAATDLLVKLVLPAVLFVLILAVVMYASIRRVVITATGGIGASTQAKLESEYLELEAKGLKQRFAYNKMRSIYPYKTIVIIFVEEEKLTAIILNKTDEILKILKSKTSNF